MESLSLDRYHFDLVVSLKEILTLLSLSNPVLQLRVSQQRKFLSQSGSPFAVCCRVTRFTIHMAASPTTLSFSCMDSVCVQMKIPTTLWKSHCLRSNERVRQSNGLSNRTVDGSYSLPRYALLYSIRGFLPSHFCN